MIKIGARSQAFPFERRLVVVVVAVLVVVVVVVVVVEFKTVAQF